MSHTLDPITGKPQKDYLQGTPAQMNAARAAIASADGLPRRGVVVGGPDYLPKVYALGAAGWTDNTCPPPLTAGPLTLLELPDEAAKYAGTTTKGTPIPASAARSALPKPARDALDAMEAVAP